MNHSHKENIEKIRAACILANSSREWHQEDPYEHGRFKAGIDIPVRLADILLAMDFALKTKRSEFDEEVSMDIEVTSYGMFIGDAYPWEETPAFWNLRNDDLTAQSPETIQFLATLLST